MKSIAGVKFYIIATIISLTVAYSSYGSATWVEWPVSEGGNGHLYALTSCMDSWTAAETEAISYGGHLVTINDAEEQSWLNNQFPFPDQFWIGLYQDFNSPDYSEPAGGWIWISGEPLTYTNWAPNSGGEPNNNYPTGEQWGAMHVWDVGLWNDYPDDTVLQGIIEIPEPAAIWLLLGGLAIAIRKF